MIGRLLIGHFIEQLGDDLITALHRNVKDNWLGCRGYLSPVSANVRSLGCQSQLKIGMRVLLFFRMVKCKLVKTAFNQVLPGLLSLWLKPYLKLPINSRASAETLIRKLIGFTYQLILRRACQIDIADC